MPKLSNNPRFRTHVRKGANGQRWVSYWWDGRPDGAKDIPLGNDYEIALEKWAELFHHKPRIKGTMEEAFAGWEREILPSHKPVTKEGYTRNLKQLRKVFATATWDTVTFPVLKQYLKKRSAKTQANREMSVLQIVWNWARGEGITSLPWPAAGMEKSKWKNKESARSFEVSDAVFSAVYAEATQTLRDAMDLASATGLRLTDCREVPMPPLGATSLRVKANKTGKLAEFSISGSSVLERLVQKRRGSGALHLRLLTTSTGREVSARMLRDWWDEARQKAAAKPENAEIKEQIEAMYLRDMRKYAADLAEDLDEASKLLQHSSTAVTQGHYRTKATKLRPVR